MQELIKKIFVYTYFQNVWWVRKGRIDNWLSTSLPPYIPDNRTDQPTDQPTNRITNQQTDINLIFKKLLLEGSYLQPNSDDCMFRVSFNRWIHQLNPENLYQFYLNSQPSHGCKSMSRQNVDGAKLWWVPMGRIGPQKTTILCQASRPATLDGGGNNLLSLR